MCMDGNAKQGMTPTGGKEMYSGTMGTNQGRGAANFRSASPSGLEQSPTGSPVGGSPVVQEKSYSDKVKDNGGNPFIEGDQYPKSPNSIDEALRQQISRPVNTPLNPQYKAELENVVAADEAQRQQRVKALLEKDSSKEMLKESNLLRTRNALYELKKKQAAESGDDKKFIKGINNKDVEAENVMRNQYDEAISRGVIKLPDVLRQLNGK